MEIAKNGQIGFSVGVQTGMDCREAIAIFENDTSKSVAQIERCSTGIANYVFIVSTTTEKFVLRCSKDKNAYKDSIYWLGKLSVCEIPIPAVLSQGTYQDYSYLILSYIRGDDIGNVYCQLNDREKKQIAGEVVAIQRKVSKIDIITDTDWTWNDVINEMLNRAEERIRQNRYFDAARIRIIRNLQYEMREYLNAVRPIPYLDDITTKNLLVYEGRLSGIVDIDWIGLGDMLTFVALTRVALLNMDLDTRYVDYLLDEIHPNAAEYKAFLFYCLIYCVDFMGERGMQFLDKVVPVNETVVRRLNGIFDVLMGEWKKFTNC
ncbi:MAG: aminoglycoside phosphotransferase family protein [bacterium]|nr:aminoglycoside phosphotransferase family protein [bacterium]